MNTYDTENKNTSEFLFPTEKAKNKQRNAIIMCNCA